MSKNSGFTLVELLIVIALVGIVAAVAVPNFLTFLPNYRLKSAGQDLFSHLQKAKLAAVQHNRVAAVRFDGSGYALFLDLDEDFVQDAGETVLASVIWSSYPDVSAGAVTFDSSTGQPTVGFAPDGIPVDAGGGLAGGSATLANTAGKSLVVTISAAGGIRVD
jgi:type II secretion system protein H